MPVANTEKGSEDKTKLQPEVKDEPETEAEDLSASEQKADITKHL